MKINTYLYALLLIIIFIMTVAYFATPSQKEGFLPGINIFYNSQKRNLRYFKENFAYSSKEYLDRFFRKTGIF